MTPDSTLLLEILSQKEKITISIYERGSTVHQAEDLSISLQEVNALCQEVITLLNKANELGKLASGIASELKKTGQLLYDQLFTDHIKSKLKNTSIENLLVLIDESLVHIPWELLYDGKQFLCLKFNIGRSVKTRQVLRESGQKAIEFPAKMLILADPLGDLKSARQEAGIIEKELDKKRSFIGVDKKVTNISTQYIKRNLRDYDIVHFAGHADYDIKDPSSSGWRLTDGQFTAKDIKSMGATAPLPSLIFSNACQSAHTQEWKIDEDFERKIFGLANAFLVSGVRHYIGASWKIPDNLSLIFAREFYCQIVLGCSIGESIRQARLKIIKDLGEDTIVWASYVLYGDPSVNLFFVSTEKAFSKKVVFQKQLIILSIIFSSIIAVGILGTILYRKYFIQSNLHEQMRWTYRNIVAVMPFENLTREVEDDWIGRGIAGVVSMKLGRLQEIAVADNAQIENIWKGMQDADYLDKKNALKIAGILGADKVITGTFQKVGDDIKIMAQLINAKDGVLIGTTEATDKYNNLFNIEDTIALQIAEKLNVKINDKERIALKESMPTDNISAFEFLTKSIVAFTDKDIPKAIDFCKKALEVDPNYAQANLNMGDLYGWSGDLESAKNYYMKSLQLAKQDQKLLLLANFRLGVLLVDKMAQIEDGLSYERKALQIAKATNDQQQYGWITYNLALAYLKKQEHEEAGNLLSESKQIFEKLNDPFGLAATYSALGLYHAFGPDVNLNKTKQYCEEALRIYESLNSKEGMARAYSFLGIFYSQINEPDESIIYFSKSLKISQEIGDKFSQSLAYGGLGDAYGRKKEVGNAEKYYKEGLKLNEEIKNRFGYKSNLYSLAILYRFQARYDEALQAFLSLSEASKEDKDVTNQASGLVGMANSYADMGKFKEAIEKYEAVLVLKNEIAPNKYILKEAYLGLGKCYEQLDNVSASEENYRLALEAAKIMQDSATIGSTFQIIGRFYENQKKISKAVQNYKQAVEYLEKVKSDHLAQTFLELSYYGLAECYKKDNNKDEAIQYYKAALTIAEANKGPLLDTIKRNLYFIDQDMKKKVEEIENKQAKALYDQASTYWGQGQNEKALPILKEAYGIESSNKQIISLLCLVYEDLGKFEESIKIHLNYIKLLDEKSDIIEIISQLSWIGGNYRHIGELNKSKDYYEKALLLAQKRDDKKSLGLVLTDYSFLLENLNEDEKAIELAKKAIELCKELGEAAYLASAYQTLSNVYAKQGNKEKALEYAMLNLKVKEESGSGDLGKSYAMLGSLYQDTDILKSLEYLNKAVVYFKEHNRTQLLGNVYHTIGSAYEKSQQVEKAIEFYTKSLEISERLNDKWTTLANYLGLEGAYFESKDYKLSADFLRKYEILSKELGREEELGVVYGAIGNKYQDIDKNEAEKYFMLSNQILEEFKSHESLKSLFINYNALGYMFYKGKDFDKAMNYFQKAIDVSSEGNDADQAMLAFAYQFLGDCNRIKGDFDKTLDAYKKAKSIFANQTDGQKLIDTLDIEIKKLEQGIPVLEKLKDYDDFVNKAIIYHKERKWELALEYYKKALVIAEEMKAHGKDEFILKDILEREKWVNNEISRIESYLKETETSKKTKPAEYLEANAILYIRQNKLDAALENLGKALNIYEGVDSKKQIGFTKIKIGLVYLTKDDINKAEKSFQEARDISKKIEDEEFKGIIHGIFGILFEKKGEYSKAEEEYNAAVSLLKETESASTYTVAYNNCLGSISYKKKDYKKSLEYYQKALEVGKAVDDSNSICLTNTMMAYINFINSSFQEANDVADNALVIAEKLDDKEIISITSLIKGKIFMEENNYEKARELINKALSYSEMTENNKLKLLTYLNLALLAEIQSDGAEYEKWINTVKDKDGYDYVINSKVAIEKVENLFREIIEEKDFFKRIWF